MDLLYKHKIEWLERPKDRWQSIVAILYRMLLTSGFILATATLVLSIGFTFPAEQQQYIKTLENYMVLFFCFLIATEIYLANTILEGLWEHRIEFYLLGFLLLQLILLELGVWDPEWTAVQPAFFIKIYLITMQIYLFVALLIRAIKAGRYLFSITKNPSVTICITFLLLVILGAFALWLPKATHGTTSPNISFIDALFTSTSAVCVTGLITLDTATVFSRMGQTIIMILFQLGGFGIMTLVGFFTLTVTKEGSLKSRVILQDVLGADALSRVRSMVTVIIIGTFLIEIIGTLILFPRMLQVNSDPITALFFSVFHSISAFCNAGFSTFTDNMESFATDYIVLSLIGLLVILGGIGFPVIYDILHMLHEKRLYGKVRTPLSIHTRMVLRWTAILLVVGFLAALLGTKWSGQPWHFILMNSIFQGIVPRTAGFNSIPMISLAPWCLVIFMFLMYIGAGPGGTAGGVKVTTLGMLYHGSIMLMKGRRNLEIMKRSFPDRLLHTAFVMCGLSISWIICALTALIWAEPELLFLDLVFEIFSAFGTVGLSLGVTAELSPIGKLIIIVTMFFGRVGPITLFLAMFHYRDERLYNYPSGSIIIG